MTIGARPLRLVVFSPSIIADIDNPGATSTRALLGALASLGHDVTHLERRGNPLLDRQLRARGSRALRAINERYPEIRVRQYDLPRGQQATIWFGTEVSTADAVLALPGTPDEVLALIAPFETPYLIRVVPPGAVGDVEVASDGPMICVARREAIHERTGTLAVAYDNITDDLDGSIPDAVDRIVVGSSKLPGWRYLPEVDIAELYGTVSTVIVLDDDPRPESQARLLLPLAAGCHVVTTRHPASGTELEGVRYVAHDELASLVNRPVTGVAPRLLERYDAAEVARALVDLVRETLVQKRIADVASRPPR